MFIRCSRELGNRALGQARSVRCTCVKGRHSAPAPAEYRFKLGNGRAVLCCPRGSHLADTVSRLIDTGRAARLMERVAKTLLCQWLSETSADEGQITAR